MKKKLFSIITIIIFCSYGAILFAANIGNNVDSVKKITCRQAKIIAKEQVSLMPFKKEYRLASPNIYDGIGFREEAKEKYLFLNNLELYNHRDINEGFRYVDSWYVVFYPRIFSFFRCYYLVVIDKKSGVVQYTHEQNTFSPVIKK